LHETHIHPCPSINIITHHDKQHTVSKSAPSNNQGQDQAAMKLPSVAIAGVLLLLQESGAFQPVNLPSSFRASCHAARRPSAFLLQAEIRDKSNKADTLRFGWDGTTALGGATEVAKPARMLDEIRAAGETIPSECELFNSNLEMDGSTLTFEETMELIDNHYETQLLEFKNGDIVNKQGENEGSAKLLSYAALAQLDQANTLKLWGQYYREVKADPNGSSHQNIRNFMKYGWEGT
jgi:hypothetical protein